ncbi:sensor histidine kinase [Streptomyces sp. NPDC049555]|uniref:sensor histidine kinase n=1 Tax=unclassified Streptomyces TaxID=2593676 RepID=UPI00342FDEEA
METQDTPSYDNAIGQAPENRRQMTIKLMWIGIWFAYLASPAEDVLGHHHGTAGTVVGAVGLLSFVAAYLVLVFRHMGRALRRPVVLFWLCVLLAHGMAFSLTLGSRWLVLFVFTSIACGAVLPAKLARSAIPLVTGVLVAVAMGAPTAEGTPGTWGELIVALVFPALLGGFAMVGVRQMALTTRALREARATVAHLAANEERLRLARDLHDLLGHSLSLITLKSELAGRMLPDRPEAAAQQVADIERVSRQALVDVREAVSGFRRPTLDAELAGARTALAAAGIAADLTRAPGSGHPDLPPDAEGALAWALREAVTNVVRHSSAGRCEVVLEEAGDTMCLTVTDNGSGAPAGTYGNGLTGLSERLALADGRLTTGPAPGGGFRLQASVPLSRRAGTQDPTLSL